MLAEPSPPRDVGRSATPSAAFLVGAKLARPRPPSVVVPRPRVVAELDSASRVALVCAPTGFGKTVAVVEWSEHTAMPVAWVSLDLLDDDPQVFWRHLIAALEAVHPDVDGVPAEMLAASPLEDAFLGVLLSQLEQSDHCVALVLDDAGRIESSEIFDALALIVDRVGDKVRLVVTADVVPPLPLARWGTAGWLVEIDDRSLRLTTDECAELAVLAGGWSRREAIELHQRWEGWPIAINLSFGERRSEGAAVAAASGRADGTVTRQATVLDQVALAVVERMPDRLRRAATALSIYDWFDAQIFHDVVGDGAAQIVDELLHGRHLLVEVDAAGGAMRFQRWLRRALSTRLKWDDPERYTDLHRRAAATWLERGDVDAARRHLLAVGDADAANELVIGAGRAAVDRDDRGAVAARTGTMPSVTEVDSADDAFDLTVAAIFAGSAHEADEWHRRARVLVDRDVGADRRVRLRQAATGAMLAMLHGDLAVAARHVAAFESLEHGTRIDPPVDRRFATVAARIALVTGDVAGARRWLTRARIDDPPTVVGEIILAGLEAWFTLLTGSVDTATSLATAACLAADAHDVSPHQGALDAKVTLAWAHAAAGALDTADDIASEARVEAELLGFDWGRVRSGAISARVRFARLGPAVALATAREVRSGLEHPTSIHASMALAPIESRALVGLGRLDAAREVLRPIESDREVGSGARRALAIATLASAERRPDVVARVLADPAPWSLEDRSEAALLLAAARRATSDEQRLVDVVEESASRGWVLPFLGHGAGAIELLGRLAIDTVHPALAAALQEHSSEPVGAASPVEQLTARERTILVHLPSHLSYSEIGARLFLSVNTVKSNLKSIYRKLGVSSRSAAVDGARRAGLL